MNKIKIPPQTVIEAIRAAHGMKTGICDILGITRPTLDSYIRNSAAIREAFEFQKIRRYDRAEYKLDEAIERGESWAVMFALKSAPERGYNEKGLALGGNVTKGYTIVSPDDWKMESKGSDD
jgi:hypothetical protein